jgi:uncharacterized protein YerC
MSYQATLRSNIIAELKRHKDHLDGFLEDMLSPQEIETIDERIKIMHAITTVSRGSRILQYGRIKEWWHK